MFAIPSFGQSQYELSLARHAPTTKLHAGNSTNDYQFHAGTCAVFSAAQSQAAPSYTGSPPIPAVFLRHG